MEASPEPEPEPEEQAEGDEVGELPQLPLRRSRSHTKQSLLSDDSFGTALQDEPDELSSWLEMKGKFTWNKEQWWELRSGKLSCWNESDAADKTGAPRTAGDALTMYVADITEIRKAADARCFVLLGVKPKPVQLRCKSSTVRDRWLSELEKAKAAATPRMSLANDADFADTVLPDFVDDDDGAVSRQGSAIDRVSSSEELASWTTPDVGAEQTTQVETPSELEPQPELELEPRPARTISGQEPVLPEGTAEEGCPPEDAVESEPEHSQRRRGRQQTVVQGAALNGTVCCQTALELGQNVEYHSDTLGRWVPAKIEGFGDGIVKLDVQPEADPDKVRPVLEPGPESTMGLEPKFEKVLMSKRKFDFFLNHCQKTGQDQIIQLRMRLEAKGFTVWHDMSADDVTAMGMEEGVSQSRNVIIFLSAGIMSREFCHAEQRWALYCGCNLIGLKEIDVRHHPAVIEKEKDSAPADLKHLLTDVNFEDFQRKEHLAETMIERVIKQRCHTVLMDGYLEKKGGDIEILRDGRTGRYTVIKQRNLMKGGSRAWQKRWFVLFDDGQLLWYENGPPDGDVDRMSSASSRASLARKFQAASIEKSGELDLCVAGHPCRWFPGEVVGLKPDRMVLEMPVNLGGSKQSRGGMELRAVDETARLHADPTDGWVEATGQFGATVVSIDDDCMETSPLQEAAEAESAVLMSWSTEQVAEWLTAKLKLPHVAKSVLEADVDGETAAGMDQVDWGEHGATGTERAKIYAKLKTLKPISTNFVE
eukprot:COSAG02_NODE_933_length_15812_cov_68.551709_13_plen_765_part_00